MNTNDETVPVLKDAPQMTKSEKVKWLISRSFLLAILLFFAYTIHEAQKSQASAKIATKKIIKK